MQTKILMCPLVSEDLWRAIRAIRSSFHQLNHNLLYGVHVVINSLDQEFIDGIVEFCESNNIQHSVTQSDGTPSTGKNAVFDVFKNSDFTHLAQLDGDDLFYPTFLTQVERHLKKYPNTDVLSTIPLDVIVENYEDGMNKLNNGVYTQLWGTNYADMHSWTGLFGRDPIVDGISIPNYARFVLFSKKIVEIDFRYDKEMIIGEDKKLHFDFLAAHQNDKISYWLTMASDMWICDRISIGIQKKHSSRENFIEEDNVVTQKLQKYVSSILNPDRSGPGEIPIDYPPMIFYHNDKIKFLNEFF
jgi:hypothetical protein